MIIPGYSGQSMAQLVVNNSAPFNNPLYLVEQVLLDTGVTVSNVTFNGLPGIPTGANATMIGFFDGSGSNIGIATGVLLNTGSIFDAVEKVRLDRVHFKNFGDSSLDFEVVYHVQSKEYLKYMDIQQEINFALFDRFEKEGIEFAYPTQTLYVKK